MKCVVIESPLSGDEGKNQFYARLCALDCLHRGEAPYASHLIFAHPDLLDDTKPEERRLGMEAGFAWGEAADYAVVYYDLGFSNGMREGFTRAVEAKKEVVFRCLPEGLWRVFVERYTDAVRSTPPFVSGTFKMRDT